METANQPLYFDPFAEDGEQMFDPLLAYSQIAENYQRDLLVHDDALDKFVAQTEAIMLDSIFLERFDAVSAIAMQMHQLCGDHSGPLTRQFMNNGLRSEQTENHDHEHGLGDHLHDDDDDEEDDD